jgi:hypothetical protein
VGVKSGYSLKLIAQYPYLTAGKLTGDNTGKSEELRIRIRIRIRFRVMSGYLPVYS